MSGTSLDGIDLAYVRFEKKQSWKYCFLATETIPYSAFWKNRFRNALFLSNGDLQKLNNEYSEFLGRKILNFIEENQPTKLDAVCSHGHTIKHEPNNGITLQIGNLPILAEIVNKTVVCDFRKQDVFLGGQGAPLVPIGDKLLFPEYDFCMNLGGFANISTEKSGKRIAYDICPVNTGLNFYAQKLGFEFDFNGNIAASGKVDENLLKNLNDLDFYKKNAPKSLGMEWVNKNIFPLLENSKLPFKNILATYTAHCAFQIAKVLGNDREKTALFTGGGAYNKFLVKSIEQKTETRLFIPEKNLVEYKEALIFGFLGVLKLRDEINVLSSVTGASKDHSSGVVFRR
ncbi:MAG TPA: anhydro-N-acetylmuramic acid kinase [Flavobacteriaceae bacterium]|nr:anhydro-N-acetylmuramic acid kinase [Flavobacteriaceae bacterium]